MLVVAFPAGPWATNCYVVAPAERQECVVVDPGMEAFDGIADAIREHHLRPAAVLLTHGHVDHVFSVTPVAGGYDIPAYIHPTDRHLLADPFAGIPGDWAAMLAQLMGGSDRLAEPDDVRELADGQRLDLAGLELVVDHTPGHTPGSLMFRTVPRELVFAGDLLFAGSIGRTDLPGGDPDAMMDSLAGKVLPLDDAIVVHPGHGPRTTIGRERASNPYLREVAHR